MCVDALKDSEFALYDIDADRLKESETILAAIQKGKGGCGKITSYCGVENRKEALRGASFVVNAIQVGLYDPCTIIDFEVPKKYGLRQTIADTLGIGGIMRALRTIPVMEDYANDMERLCPNALFLNYTNPMCMLTGYMQRYTNIKTVGLCHSVQSCAPHLLDILGMEEYKDGFRWEIAGINHQAWLLKIEDRNVVAPAREYAEVKRNMDNRYENVVIMSIELPDGRIVTGKTSSLLGASAALLLNALKVLADIPDELHLIAPEVIDPIQHLKVDHLGNRNPRLHTDETLIALSISAATNPMAEYAMDQLSKLRGCDVHSSVILSSVDERTFKRLGVNLTCEPKYSV
jgi:hypothetical protein